jgi:hypothetical protein
MSRNPSYRSGDWLYVCDQCGIESWASEDSVLEWDGLRVHRRCWDYRHPQELIRPIVDCVPPPWTRPWNANFLDLPNLGDQWMKYPVKGTDYTDRYTTTGNLTAPALGTFALGTGKVG